MLQLKLQQMLSEQSELGDKRVKSLRHDLLQRLELRQKDEMAANEKTIQLRRQRLALAEAVKKEDRLKPKVKGAAQRKPKSQSASNASG
jgi:hypothetical protein